MARNKLILKIFFVVIVLVGALFGYWHYAWKTYTNTRDNYKINAPISYNAVIYNDPEGLKYYNGSAGWTIGDPGPSGEKCHRTGEFISISVENMEQYNNGLILLDKFGLNQTPDKTVTIGGLSAPWFTTKSGITVGPIVHKDKAYTFNYSEPCDKPNGYTFPQYLNEFNKMLQSFEFNN